MNFTGNFFNFLCKFQFFNNNSNLTLNSEWIRGTLQDKDLVIAVGGDGTILNTSSFLDDSIPLLGVNSDPTRPEEQGVTNVKDERRSRGALCAATATTLHDILPQILYGNKSPGMRSRIQCLIRSAYTETRLPPALNDLLLAHPIPAAVSRFRLTACKGNVSSSFSPVSKYQEVIEFFVWCIIIFRLISPKKTYCSCSLSMFGRVECGYQQLPAPLPLCMQRVEI